jgi:uncharacterized membrane protein YagU involved in acid resistance
MKLKSINFLRAILGGLLGIVGMTILGLWIAPTLGMPRMDPAALLAKGMHLPLTVGWMAHIITGIILALIYALVQHYLPGPAVIRGALFSIAPWLLAQLVMLPLMGLPFFMGSGVMAMQSLIGHLIYGVILGSVYRKG